MKVGYGKGIELPPSAGTFILSPGSRYELDGDGWHSVRPLEKPSYSLMISGKPTGREMPVTPKEPLKELTPERFAEMIRVFRELLTAGQVTAAVD